MTTGWLIVNIVLIALVAAVVAVPAVLIPNLLDRDTRRSARRARLSPAATPARRWVADGQRSTDAA